MKANYRSPSSDRESTSRIAISTPNDQLRLLHRNVVLSHLDVDEPMPAPLESSVENQEGNMAITRLLVTAKIQRATVIRTDVTDVDSITVDAELLKAADILPFQQVHVVNAGSGAWVETHTVAGEPGSGIVQLNGAAAHLASVGDLIIIIAYAQVAEPVPPNWQPTVVYVDRENHVTDVHRLLRSGEWALVKPGCAPLIFRRAPSQNGC